MIFQFYLDYFPLGNVLTYEILRYFSWTLKGKKNLVQPASKQPKVEGLIPLSQLFANLSAKILGKKHEHNLEL